ncbi:hypothetical protein ACQ7CZ_21135 [Chryseobacterium arthrosphaerae]|uniref:hypothetical protein n=1 Tax=Chryseobacterium arthrosphaerae TaxID=651561 RepID=UPI003D32FF9C
MKVTLLKRVGDNPEGKELEITDESVLHAWVELGVIENPFTDIDTSENYSNYKLDELKALAEEKELEITDESVLHAWVELGVIENPFTDIDTSENYSNYKLDELKALARRKRTSKRGMGQVEKRRFNQLYN